MTRVTGVVRSSITHHTAKLISRSSQADCCQGAAGPKPALEDHLSQNGHREAPSQPNGHAKHHRHRHWSEQPAALPRDPKQQVVPPHSDLSLRPSMTYHNGVSHSGCCQADGGQQQARTAAGIHLQLHCQLALYISRTAACPKPPSSAAPATLLSPALTFEQRPDPRCQL